MVDAGTQQIAIPLQDVGEVINLDDDRVLQNIRTLNDCLVLNHQDDLVPLIDLANEFNQGTEGDLSSKNIVVIRGEGFTYGVIVDFVHDIEEVVVKKMAKQLQHSESIFQGATLIGDGEMALILDLEMLANKCNISIDEVEDENFFNSDEDSSYSSADEYLQFSVESRDYLAIHLSRIDRLEEIRASDISYTGNIPVVRYRGDFLPLIDVEFALDFSDHYDFSNPEIHNVLVVTVGNVRAGFIVKDILDISIASEEIDTLIKDRHGLLGTTYINERTINVIDAEYIINSYKELYNQKPKKLVSKSDDELPEAA